VDLDTAAGKETRQPKTVAPSLMGQYHPGDPPPRTWPLDARANQPTRRHKRPARASNAG
jgi:hypothetical protein